MGYGGSVTRPHLTGAKEGRLDGTCDGVDVANEGPKVGIRVATIVGVADRRTATGSDGKRVSAGSIVGTGDCSEIWVGKAVGRVVGSIVPNFITGRCVGDTVVFDGTNVGATVFRRIVGHGVD